MTIVVFLHSQHFPALPPQLAVSSREGQTASRFFLKCDLQSESIVWLGWSSLPFSFAHKDGSTEGTGFSSK